MFGDVAKKAYLCSIMITKKNETSKTEKTTMISSAIEIPSGITIEHTHLTALDKCFGATTQSYKYYWLMAMVQHVCTTGEAEFPAITLVYRMVGMAWMPICKFGVRLAEGDGLGRCIAQALQFDDLFGCEESVSSVVAKLQQATASPEQGRQLERQLLALLDNVPYCFLSPWLAVSGDKIRSQYRQQGLVGHEQAPYALSRGDDGQLWVRVSPQWQQLLTANAQLVMDYAMGALQQWAQKKNPQLQIPSFKLDWRIHAEVLQRQIFYWDTVLTEAQRAGSPMRCLFDHNVLGINDYRIDHYMPSTFPDANKLWSTYPASLQSRPSPTGNHHNIAGRLLPQLAAAHQTALRLYAAAKQPTDALQADFADWNIPLLQLVSLSDDAFLRLYSSRFLRSENRQMDHMNGYAQTVADDSMLGQGTKLAFQSGSSNNIYLK